MKEKPILKRYSKPVLMVFALILLDQYTKHLIEVNFKLYESVSIIDGFFNLTYVLNKGAAFSFMAGIDSPWLSRFFISASVIAIIIVAGIYRETPCEEKLFKTALILIMSGASGNLLDRLRVGSVTDFLDFYIASHHWPAFNVADSCITIGVTLICVHWLLPIIAGKKNS